MSDRMHLGLSLPQMGHLADPAATRLVAQQAEALGYDSLWTNDRLLSPLDPRNPYPGALDGVLPTVQQAVLDPVVCLTLAAAVTERVRLGTDVLIAPLYAPVLLARTLATLDAVSAGRLVVGLGLGWSEDEFEAAAMPFARRGERLEEVLDVMHALWRDDVVSIETSRERIAPSVVDVKPPQAGGPPILLATFNPTGLDRVARLADGWLPTGMPFDVMATMWDAIRHLAADHGRDPDALRMVVRVDPELTDSPLGDDRMAFTGTIGQVAADVERAAVELGAHEVILDLHHSARTAQELLDVAQRLTAGVLVG
jgi:probable F420-dependent oxidoreductase